MKLFSPKSKTTPPTPGDAPSATRPSGVAVVRGDAFFVRRLELPAGTAPDEVAGFVELQLEELAPFPLEQLYHGHVRAADGSAVFVYAAYKRSFPAEQAQAWSAAPFVLPDFAPALHLKFDAATIVFLRSDTTLTALSFEDGKQLPARVASRPLAPDAPPDAVGRVRRIVLDAVGATTSRELALRLSASPEQQSKGLAFVLAPDGSGSAREVFVPLAECWAMDVRDAEFVAQQRKRLGFDVMLWRVVQGAAAALTLLLAVEILMLAGNGYVAWLDHRVATRDPEVRSLMDKQEVGSRLEEFGRSGINPFAMLTTAASDSLIRGRNIVLTSATSSRVNVLQISGTAPSVTMVNAYETALKSVPQVASVAVGRRQAVENGATFTMEVTFRPDAFTRTEVRAAGQAGTVAQGGATP